MGKSCRLENPARLPDSNKLAEVREPIIEANILVPAGLRRYRDRPV